MEYKIYLCRMTARKPPPCAALFLSEHPTFFIDNRERSFEQVDAASPATAFPTTRKLYTMLEENILKLSVNVNLKIRTERDEPYMYR